MPNFMGCRYLFLCTTKTSYVRKWKLRSNKMQSETADFAPGAATWRTRLSVCVVSDSAHLFYYVKSWCRPQNRKYIRYRTAVRGGSSHNHKKIWWNLEVPFFTDARGQITKQTDRHTDTLITILRTWARMCEVVCLQMIRILVINILVGDVIGHDKHTRLTNC